MINWVIVCIAAVTTAIVVWTGAHQVVAHECIKLGAFYVGQTVFECKVREGK